MANIKQAAEDLKNIANRFKGILEVQAALEQIGDIQAAAKENENLKAKATADYQEAKRQLENIHHRIQESGKAADAAEAKASEIIANANKRADGIISESKKASEAIKQDGDRLRDSINSQVAGLKSQVAKLEGDIQAKKQELENLQSAIKEAKSKVASL